MGVVFSECIWKSGCGIHRQMRPMSMGNSTIVHIIYEYECLHNNKIEIITLKNYWYYWYYDSITLLMM